MTAAEPRIAPQRSRLAPKRIGRGVVVVLAGPDGAGKTTLAAQLEADLAREQEVTRFHHRPRVLPSRKASRQETHTPHADAPYPTWISCGKVVYLVADYVLGWLTRVRPAQRRGGLVLLERGWWDLVVDPRRYRLSGADGLIRAVARVVPRPAMTVVLDADPSVLYARKAELPLDELKRQRSAWLQMSKTDGSVLVLDATRDVAALSNEVVDRLKGSSSRSSKEEGRLVRFKRGRGALFVPSARPALARSGLRIYQPMSLRSRVGWKAARVLAGAGAFRLLPASESAAAALESVAPFIPRAGTAAIAESRHHNRFVALILDRSGDPIYLAKCAVDEVERDLLRREVDALSRFGTLLSTPLRSSKILREDDGIVLFEPTAWVARRHPWKLPEDVAAALGRFHAHHVRPETGAPGHPVHGDFTPWNLLQVQEEWVLVDWEAATLRLPTFDDPFHFLLQASGHLGSPSPRAILAAVEGRGPLAPALLAFARGAERAPESLKPSLAAFLMRTLPHLNESDQAERRSIEIRRGLLAALQRDPASRHACES